MMHRYVAVIQTRAGSKSHATILVRAKRHYNPDAQVLDTPLAAAWVFKRSPSQLGHRPLRGGGCLIGLDFRQDAHNVATLLQDTWGAYIAVGVDAAAGAVTVVRDPTGRIACWRLQLDGADVLFSHYEDVYWLREHPPGINWPFVAHHLGQDWLYGEDTGLEGVTELLPGEELTYAQGRSTKRVRWWPHLIAGDAHSTLGAAQAAIRHAGEISVSAWAARYGRVSIDLSGGLDSAIVLGLLRGVARHPDVVGLNIKTPGAEGDERFYAQKAAAMHGIPLRCRDMASDSLDFELRFPRKFLRPTTNIVGSGYPALRSEFARQEGAEAQFTGLGGDTIFNLGLQISVLDDYLHHGGSLRGYLAAAAYFAQLTGSTVWSAFAETAKHHFGGPRRPDAIFSGDNNPLLTPEARAAVDYRRFAHPWADAVVGHAPTAKLRQIILLIQLQTFYRREGNADVSEEAHVLMSQPLLEACLRTPSHWSGVGGMQRGMARRAFADLLPTEIRERRSKGGSSAYFVQFAAQRLGRIRELLLDGRLVQRGLLDRGALERTMTPSRVGSSKDIFGLLRYLRTEIWVRQTEADATSHWAAAPPIHRREAAPA